MLRDGQFIRDHKPVIGRAYQKPLPRYEMTNGGLRYQEWVIRRYAKHTSSKHEGLSDAIIGGAALVVFFLALVFIPELMR